MLPELLAPAGNLEKCATAFLYGADAVYLGGMSFNLRAAADGFTHEELVLAVAMAERSGGKVYYTLNAFPRQQDIRLLPHEIEDAAAAGVHAFIIADPGVLRLARQYAPKTPVHISTQANTTNSQSAFFWAEQGATRVNLARELCADDILAIRREAPQIELEVFVHGAMCLAISGKCLLSAWLNSRSANEGRCTHPCRFAYKPLATEGMEPCPEEPVIPSLTVAEQTRQTEPVWIVQEGEPYSTFWAPQDLCLIQQLPWFTEHGIHSLKIEGRIKGSSYVAHTVDAYASARAAALRTDTPYDAQPYVEELLNTASRPLCSGFFLTPRRVLPLPEPETLSPLVARVAQAHDGRPGAWHIELRGTLRADQPIELMLPGMRRPIVPPGAYRLETMRGEIATVLHSGMHGILHIQRDDILPGIFIRSRHSK